MKQFYTKLYQQMEEATKAKRQILQFIINQLDWIPDDCKINSFWKNCKHVLEKLCTKQQIVTFWPNDDMIKSLFSPMMELNKMFFEITHYIIIINFVLYFCNTNFNF